VNRSLVLQSLEQLGSGDGVKRHSRVSPSSSCD
jgi:hypothetical protein